MSERLPAARALDAMQIPYRMFKHPGPIASLEQAARERHQAPDQIVRSILFRVSESEFVMVLIAGDRQVDWKTLRKYLGQSRVTLASEEQVLRVTGSERGGVSPLGLPAPLKILADESVFANEEISLGSGVRGTTIILQAADLRRALGDVVIGKFAS